MKNISLIVVVILLGMTTNRAMGQWSGSSSNTGNTPIAETPQVGKKKMRARFGLGLTLLNAQSGRINANILSDFKNALPFEITSDISSFEAGFVIGNYIRTKVGSYFSFNMGSSTLDMKSTDMNSFDYTANMQIITQEYSYVYGFRQVLSPNPNISANESLPEGYLALQYNVGATLGSVIGNYTQDLQFGQTSEVVSSAYGTINIGASLVAGRHFDFGINLAIPIKKPSATILGSGMPFDIISKDKFGTNLNIKGIYFF